MPIYGKILAKRHINVNFYQNLLKKYLQWDQGLIVAIWAP